MQANRNRLDAWVTRLAAGLLVSAIYLIDSTARFEIGVPTLYVLPLALLARDASKRAIRIWAAIFIGLALLAWGQVHASMPDVASSARLLFACTAIVLTYALLINQKNYQQAQIDLEKSRADLEIFSDSVPQLLWRTLPDGTVDYFNRRYTEMTGHDLAEAIEKQNWGEWFHPEDWPAAQELFTRAVADQVGDEIRLTFRMRHADGSYRWMSLVGRAVRDPLKGTLTAWYGGSLDVHDEILAQNAVRELNEQLEHRVLERTDELLSTEQQLATLFEMSNITYAEQDLGEALTILDDLKAEGVTDLRGYMNANPVVLDRCIAAITNIRVNSALARLLGYESVEALAATPPVQNAQTARAVLLNQLEMAFLGLSRIDGRTTLVGRDGRTIPVFYNVHRLSNERQLSTHIDISAQERIEEMRLAAQAELARANRVATVGAFSASIAHELNQPIASISMDVQIAKRALNAEVPDIATTLRILDRLVRTSDRVAGIVRHTRGQIARDREPDAAIDLVDLASETIELLQREMRNSDTRIRQERSRDCLHVWGSRIELQQVLVNLLTNAMDAVAASSSEHRIVTLSLIQHDDWIDLEVADRGGGIPEEQLDRLFQPFFTTKPNGVGMGLQICRSIIEAMGGELTARNRAQGGAVFSCKLPVHTVHALQ